MIQNCSIIYLILLLGLGQIQAQWVQSFGVPGSERVYPVTEINNKLFAGSVDGNVFISDDKGVNWTTTHLDVGFDSYLIRSIAFISSKESGIIIFVVSLQNIYRSLDTGKTWSKIPPPGGGWTFHSLLVDSISSTKKTLYLSTHGAGVFRSNDNGFNWVQINKGLTHLDDYSLILCPDSLGGSNLLLGTGNGTIFISTDHGDTWKQTVISNTTNSGIYTFALFSTPSGGVNVIAGTHDSRILISKDRGNTWDVVCLNVNNGQIHSLLIVPNGFGGSNIFAGTAEGKSSIVLSMDEGKTWKDVSDNILGKNINFYSLLLVTDKQNQKYIVSGSEAANGYGGVWRRSLFEMVTSIRASSGKIDKDFVLKQNYPNPFNPTTRIDFVIPKSSFVTLKVFDILGREITTLVNTELKQGYHSEIWNAMSYPSGIYFYSLQSDKFKEVKKLLLQK